MNDIAADLYALFENTIMINDDSDNPIYAPVYYGQAIEDATYPYITYIETDNTPILLHKGQEGDADEPKTIVETNWDFRVWGTDAKEINSIFNEIIQIINTNNMHAGMIRGQAMPVMIEDNLPNDILYSRLIECKIYAED